MSQLWKANNNSVIATLQEKVTIDLDLPIDFEPSLEIVKISGQLPPGVRIQGQTLVGTPFEVARDTNYKFVLRATTDDTFQDITFNILVVGPDDPVWITNEGYLPAVNDRLFVLDNEIIDYQLVAIDSDLSAGDELEYYIADGDGILPPGIQLTPDGRLVGVVEPILALDKRAGNGGYDTNPYGEFPLDFSFLSDNGFSAFFYDTETYDFSFSTQSPKKLNRRYRFAVTVSDGDVFARREFDLYVVGDDFLRADNTIMKVGTGVFTADNTHIRTPVWITPANLGFKRANNYTTLYLDIVDDYTLSGNVIYTEDEFNNDGSVSTLPPGMELDSLNGEVVGRIPYQPAVTQEYKFTIRATRFTGDTDYVEITATVYEDTLAGKNNFKVGKLPVGTADGVNDIEDLRNQIIELNGRAYRIISVDNSQEEYDTIFLSDTLRPKFFVKTFDSVSAGVDYFYIEGIDYITRELLLNTKLNYSPTEIYNIDSVFPYIEWQISTTLADIEIDWDVVPVPEDIVDSQGNTITETTSEKITRLFTELTGYSVEVYEATSKSVRFIAAKTADTKLSRLQTIFVAAGDEITHEIVQDNIERIKLDTVLTRNFQQGQTISWALKERDFFTKAISSDANEDINNPFTSKTFTLKVIGEVDSTINFTTPNDLGNIRANFISTLKVEATTTIPDAPLIYELIDGTLPPGVSLSYDGELIGKPRQFEDGQLLGLTSFDGGDLNFDGVDPVLTTFDREFVFTIKAQDRFGYSAVEQEFKLLVLDPDDILYSNLYMEPLIEPEARNEYRRFISDPEIFPPNAIYRPNDPEFGIQPKIRMLGFAGIETKNISEYITAISKNHKKKRFIFGEIKTAVAKRPGTNEIVYEVVYVEIIDPASPKQGESNKQFKIKGGKKITADSVSYTVKDDVTRYRTGTPQIGVNSRSSTDPVHLDNERIIVKARDGDLIQDVDNQDLDITLQDGSEVNVTLTQTDSEPWRFRPSTNTTKADSNAVKVNQTKDNVKYLSNLQNMQDRVRELGAVETDFLPLWMRTPQEDSIGALAYVPAVPLAYCKPGKSQEILLNIQNRDFDLKLVDFTVDRYIIDSTDGNSNEQYLVFANYSFNA